MGDPLPSGSVVGILGGGQLGRMLAMAAARLGYRTHIYEPGPAPAADVASAVTHAPFDDAAALSAFAASCDVVTFEFENVPLATLDVLSDDVPCHPGRRALEVSQDRLTEKTFLASIGLLVAPYATVSRPNDLDAALAKTGLPAILKTRRFGYDGKGQVRVTEAAGARSDLALLEGAPAIAEGVVAFTKEISVIAARGRDGSVAAYDPGENVHRDGILATTTVPAAIPGQTRMDAVLIASRILGALDYVGVLGVELFVTDRGLVVNEIAPRVHNSGHWTQAGTTVDQFEQHIRAITGWPLGDGERHADVLMENLIGGDVARAPQIALERGAQVHLYGKSEVRPGRKMGHVNRVLGVAG
jgi:5-(carboxyamino)imidazole ribonucleotide synthase